MEEEFEEAMPDEEDKRPIGFEKHGLLTRPNPQNTVVQPRVSQIIADGIITHTM